jgi:hypothetical protein
MVFVENPILRVDDLAISTFHTNTLAKAVAVVVVHADLGFRAKLAAGEPCDYLHREWSVLKPTDLAGEDRPRWHVRAGRLRHI